MKKSIMTFALIILSIVCLLFIAVFGIRAVGIPGVFDEGGIRLGLDLAGGSTILYEADITRTPSSAEMNSAVAMIRGRLDMLNYTEATVASSGANQIVVEIPGISDPEEAVTMLGASAVLEFKDSDGNNVLDGSDVVSASSAYGDIGNGYNEWFITLKLNSAAVAKWAIATGTASRKPEGENYIAIYMDETELMKPRVQNEINSDSCTITGNYDRASAEYWAGLISAGSLPFALKDVQLTATGPSLGEKSLQSSLISGAIGMLIVMLFMIAYYRVPGLIASIALCAYVGIIGVILVITQVNLSLPGIAGIILSVGMAVDANVIIFERIKEELRGGKTIRAAVSSGFKRAFTAILDSNITTVMVAAVLWIFGTGPIVGFAQVWFIGVIVSMFTAITVTRWLLSQLFGMNITNTKLYGL
jgi:protein-export SecD/SecF family membrane protein